MDPTRERSSDDDDTVRDVLSGFNAEELVDDPVATASERDDPPAATPDSPDPI